MLPAGADIVLSAKYAVASQAELSSGFAALPDRTTFDLSTLVDLSNQNPQLSENNTQGGDYYILLHGLNAAGAGQPFTLTASAAKLEITSITPQTGLKSSTTEIITVGGAQFTPATTVSLVGANGKVYPAGSVVFTDSTKIAATFDLTAIPLGSYAVRAASGNRSAIASTQFLVASAAAGNFASAVIMSPETVRVGNGIGVSITINGVGNSITPVPLVQVDADSVASGQEHQQLVDPALPLFFQGRGVQLRLRSPTAP